MERYWEDTQLVGNNNCYMVLLTNREIASALFHSNTFQKRTLNTGRQITYAWRIKHQRIGY